LDIIDQLAQIYKIKLLVHQELMELQMVLDKKLNALHVKWVIIELELMLFLYNVLLAHFQIKEN